MEVRAALDPAPARASPRSVVQDGTHPELDATVFMRDDPVFERDVPGEKGKQGALGGVFSNRVRIGPT